MFELNNIVNKKYTGVFSVSLSVTFYAPTDQFPEANSADVILPLTTGSAKGSQMLVYPGDTRRTLELPLNSVEAYLEIIATGAAEEVNRRNPSNITMILLAGLDPLVPDTSLTARNSGTPIRSTGGEISSRKPAYSAKDRTVRCRSESTRPSVSLPIAYLRLASRLVHIVRALAAGVVHPFPVIYTGGANPLLWRPLASLRAFDIPSMYLDLTPFLPM